MHEPILYPVKDFTRLTTEHSDSYDAICPKQIHYCISKNKSPLLSLAWINFGKFVITGAQSGEISRWSGTTFTSELSFPAHSSAVTALNVSKNEIIVTSGDETGLLKLWDRNLNFKNQFNIHNESIKGISFSPENNKIITCSDDKTVKITDLETGKKESEFLKHGAEVKACDWHPYKSLVISGGKDNFAKLWDPHSGEELSTLYAHHQYITKIKWHQNGNWVATGSKDASVRVHDIRTMKTLAIFQQHKKEISGIAWHPNNEDLLVSGSENMLIYWNMRDLCLEKDIGAAHDKEITGIEWNPLGHMLATCSLDNTTKFWGRAKPGDTIESLYKAVKVMI